jgi:hypothetical protein
MLSLAERWLSLRNRLIADPRFQKFAAATPGVRTIARNKARGVFDLLSGFIYSQVLLACVRLDLFRLLEKTPLSLDAIAARTNLPLDPARRLLDARAPERYRGDVEPIDAVAGHVPGARNHPFAASLDASGRFRSTDELRRALLASLDGVPAERTVAMCGSGVTACHLLLALEHAGLPGARLYPGSWSEWSRDPARPVATGPEP